MLLIVMPKTDQRVNLGCMMDIELNARLRAHDI